MRDLPRPNKPLSVLIIDDEARLREVLLRAIPEMEFSCRGARSGEEGLQLLAQQPAELMVVDLNLPGMGGLEFLERVQERWPDTSAIVLTGYGDLKSAQQAIRLSVVDFLSKPASLGDIEQALDRARQRYWRQNPPGLPEPLAEVEDLPEPEDDDESGDKRSTLADLEREHILAVLDRNKGNRAATAAELGISVRTLYYRLAQFQRKDR